MRKNKTIMIVLSCFFTMLFGLSIYAGINVMAEEQEVILQKITVIYDENSGVLVNDEGVTFNDKNQTASFKAVIKSTQNYDIKISDIKLSTPTEDFLDYKVESLDSDILKAGSEKEIVFTLETTGIKGWGKNFSNQLTANINFEKVSAPTDEKKEEQPVAPATTTHELISKNEKIEISSITNNAIEFTADFKVSTGETIAVWLYSKPIFLGYFDVIEINGIKQIIGLAEVLQKVEVEAGEHNLALVTKTREALGYINIYIDENKTMSEDKNESSTENKEDESIKEDIYQEVENPNTGDKTLFIVLIAATLITAFCIIMASKNTITRYSVFFILLNLTVALTNAETLFNLPMSFKVNFKSQNVMKKSYIEDENGNLYFENYWKYNKNLKNFYIKNENIEIDEYVERFDVSEDKNGRVMAYVVNNKDNSTCKDLEGNTIKCYDLYLVADGIIYPNQDAGWYFDDMLNIDLIDNLSGLDTSYVTNMRSMFNSTGYYSSKFVLDLSNFDTSSANDFFGMFHMTSYMNPNFTLDVSNFDTSNVTNMSKMFYETGYMSKNFTLNFGDKFDTSKVTTMAMMFYETGYNSEVLNLDVSRFDTSNVTEMNNMFYRTGYSNPSFILDVSNFDTSNVSNMAHMFYQTGYNNEDFTLDVSNFDTSSVTKMNSMFFQTGYKSKVLTLDVSNFDTSKVTQMNSMFYQTGYNSEIFDLDVSGFDTGNVTTMRSLFNYAGYKSKVFSLDVSGFDTSKVTDMKYMFSYVGYNNPEFTLDVSNFNTSNVTDMLGMFNCTGYSNPNFTLDVSGFDTSKVTDMSQMFYKTGYNSTKLNTSITLRNPNLKLYSSMISGLATMHGAHFRLNYTKDTENLVNSILATKQSNSEIYKGVYIVNFDELNIGDEITLGGESFNIINTDGDNITVLAKYNLNVDYKQTQTTNYLTFAKEYGWDFYPGPKEIDIQQFSTNPKIYINNYVEFLQNVLEDKNISGNLITLNELKKLGCSIPLDYGDIAAQNRTCKNSPYKAWLVNGQDWWTRSAYAHATFGQNVWRLSGDVISYTRYYSTNSGVRPVITIPKETLKSFV